MATQGGIATTRRRLRLWIVAAVLLLAAGALLSGLAEERKTAPRREVEFPRWMRSEERERAAARRTLAPAASVSSPAPAEGGSAPGRRDPFLVALPRDSRTGVFVLEANALRHSRIGELFVSCILEESGGNPFDEMRDEAGIDPLKDVDRVAFAGEGLVVSGFFDRARFEKLLSEAPMERRGEHGRVYSTHGPSGAGSSVGVWRDQLIVFGPAPFVRETLDRIDGRIPEDPKPAIPEELTYGEAYGVVPGSALRQLFSGPQDDLGRRLAEVAQRIELHADAMRDVALVARVTGADAAQLDDLATAFGAALSVGRLDARVRGSEEVAELLEHALVRRGPNGFSLELALPVEIVERWFEGCGTGRRAAEPER